MSMELTSLRLFYIKLFFFSTLISWSIEWLWFDIIKNNNFFFSNFLQSADWCTYFQYNLQYVLRVFERGVDLTFNYYVYLRNHLVLQSLSVCLRTHGLQMRLLNCSNIFKYIASAITYCLYTLLYTWSFAENSLQILWCIAYNVGIWERCCIQL